jgi:hypothetical protein
MLPLYTRKELVDLPFYGHEVDAAAIDTRLLTEGVSDCGAGGWRDIGFSSQAGCVDHYAGVAANRITDFVD